jgi:hypothetical protein
MRRIKTGLVFTLSAIRSEVTKLSLSSVFCAIHDNICRATTYLLTTASECPPSNNTSLVTLNIHVNAITFGVSSHRIFAEPVIRTKQPAARDSELETSSVPGRIQRWRPTANGIRIATAAIPASMRFILSRSHFLNQQKETNQMSRGLTERMPPTKIRTKNFFHRVDLESTPACRMRNKRRGACCTRSVKS